MKLYLAGPMRGIPLFNFPAFDRYKLNLEALGHEVVSPADLDRELGFSEHDAADKFDAIMPELLRRDFDALSQCDGIALMPGWRRSRGAAWELHGAELMELAVLDAETGGPLKETICQEADRIVSTDRRDVYSHPYDNFGLIADLWSADMGFPFSRHDVGRLMVLLKVARLKASPHHRDSKVDGAGYMKCLDLVSERELANVES